MLLLYLSIIRSELNYWFSLLIINAFFAFYSSHRYQRRLWLFFIIHPLTHTLKMTFLLFVQCGKCGRLEKVKRYFGHKNERGHINYVSNLDMNVPLIESSWNLDVEFMFDGLNFEPIYVRFEIILLFFFVFLYSCFHTISAMIDHEMNEN